MNQLFGLQHRSRTDPVIKRDQRREKRKLTALTFLYSFIFDINAICCTFAPILPNEFKH